MPLEALIDPDTGGVIVAKPIGSVWGRCEVNAVMLLDDPALEEELAARGGEHVVYPYASWEEIEHSVGDRVMKHRELREESLVKVAVPSAAALEIASRKQGVLRAPDADRPVIKATITEVAAPPTPQKGGQVVVSGRPLPEKN